MLTGVLSLSFFIHNGALSILRNQRHPQNNVRDIIIAYLLVCVTYLTVGMWSMMTVEARRHARKKEKMRGAKDVIVGARLFFFPLSLCICLRI